MAWTDPIDTAVTGVVAPAAMWNEVRDNFALVGAHLIAKKPSDEGPISSTTFQADADLIAPVGANDVWLFQYFTRWVAAATGHPKMRWTMPTSGIGNLDYVGRNSAGTVTHFQVQTDTSPLDPGAAMFAPTSNTFGFLIGPITIMYIGGGTAGNVGFEWAPNAAVNLTGKANSTLWGVKLA